MKKWANNAEKITGKIIPYMLVLLFVVLFIDLFFSDFYYSYEIYMHVADFLIIFVFSVDLLLKLIRIRKIGIFFKECWPDIIAVFPFLFLIHSITALSELFSNGFGQGIDSMQVALHSSTGLGLNKSARFMNIMRPLFRLPRFFKLLAKPRREEGRKKE